MPLPPLLPPWSSMVCPVPFGATTSSREQEMRNSTKENMNKAARRTRATDACGALLVFMVIRVMVPFVVFDTPKVDRTPACSCTRADRSGTTTDESGKCRTDHAGWF